MKERNVTLDSHPDTACIDGALCPRQGDCARRAFAPGYAPKQTASYWMMSAILGQCDYFIPKPVPQLLTEDPDHGDDL